MAKRTKEERRERRKATFKAIGRIGAAVATGGASELARAGVAAIRGEKVDLLRTGAAMLTGGASELALGAGKLAGKVNGPARGALAVLTGGASEVLRLGSKALDKRGHKGDGPSPHPFDNGPVLPTSEQRSFLERRPVARRLAGLHGPVLPAHPANAGGATLAVHPSPGRLHVDRRAIGRVRAGLRPRKI